MDAVYYIFCMGFCTPIGGYIYMGMIVVEPIILFVAWIYFRHVIECCHEYLILHIAIFFFYQSFSCVRINHIPKQPDTHICREGRGVFLGYLHSMTN